MNKEDIDFLISIQDLEQPDFDNACLERENKRLNKDLDTAIEICNNRQKEIVRLNNIIDELILECYNCDMTFGEFKNIWKKAYNKEYNSKDLDKLKELKGSDKE